MQVAMETVSGSVVARVILPSQDVLIVDFIPDLVERVGSQFMIPGNRDGKASVASAV
jgi:hypothetical protein